MITRLRIQNLKRFGSIDIPLGSPVVFIGPNNSGKTTALQALALWQLGVRTWNAKRGGGKSKAKERTGVSLGRRELVHIPVPSVGMLWRDQHLRKTPAGSTKATQNIQIVLTVDGVDGGAPWSCAMEFDYQNDEFVLCRPRRESGEDQPSESPVIPPAALEIEVAFLPPMSGLEANERRIDRGAIEVSLGQGKTADMLRNLCYQVWQRHQSCEGGGEWGTLVSQIERLFGVRLEEPEYVDARGEIMMGYREIAGGKRRPLLDLSAAGRGLQQTLLLLAFLRWRQKSVLLIDEPDAHLEILRQTQIYRELCETASRLRCSLIVATHSEVVMNEAADHTVVAFVGQPHRVKNTKEVRKALVELGFEQYLQAEETGWVLYLEGSTDLAALRTLARICCPEALPALERPFHRYVLNQPDLARRHFFGLREAFPRLRGIAIFDNSPDVTIHGSSPLIELKWSRREMENYFCSPSLLNRWVERSVDATDLFGHAELDHRRQVMRQAIEENTAPIALRNPRHKFWTDAKVSEEYLPAVFESFFTALGLPVMMNKASYIGLAELLEPDEVDPEVVAKLRAIADVHNAASAAPNS